MTDELTAAARAEAKRRYRLQGMHVGTPTDRERAAFEAGAHWAADPAPCAMKQGEPYDFAWCETHDTTFPLGDTCKFDGRDPAEVYADEADEQRARAVRAEMHLESAEDRGAARVLRRIAAEWERIGYADSPLEVWVAMLRDEADKIDPDREPRQPVDG